MEKEGYHEKRVLDLFNSFFVFWVFFGGGGLLDSELLLVDV